MMPHDSSVTSMRRASGSAEGSGLVGSAEGVAAGVRPTAGSGETPAWGVESGVFADGWPVVELFVGAIDGVSLKGGSVSTVNNMMKTLS